MKCPYIHLQHFGSLWAVFSFQPYHNKPTQQHRHTFTLLRTFTRWGSRIRFLQIKKGNKHVQHEIKKKDLEIMRRDSAKFMRISWKQRQRRKRNRDEEKSIEIFYIFCFFIYFSLSCSTPRLLHPNFTRMNFCSVFNFVCSFLYVIFPSFIQNFSFSLFTFFASSCFPSLEALPPFSIVSHRLLPFLGNEAQSKKKSKK